GRRLRAREPAREPPRRPGRHGRARVPASAGDRTHRNRPRGGAGDAGRAPYVGSRGSGGRDRGPAGARGRAMSGLASSEQPEITVVIVTCNGRTLLGDCLASLAAQDYPSSRVELLVYDNGSDDGTPDWLAREWPRVRVIANATNDGFAAPNN